MLDKTEPIYIFISLHLAQHWDSVHMLFGMHGSKHEDKLHKR